MKPANFRQRLLTAIIFGILMIASIFIGPLAFALLMLVTYYLGVREFYKLLLPNASLKARISGIITGILIFSVIYFFNFGWIEKVWLWSLPLFIFIPFVVALFDNYEKPADSIGIIISGVIFLAVPLSLFASLMLLEPDQSGITGTRIILAFLAILWVFDSTAYIVGSFIGKHKLHGRISPGKTWEGSLGGFVFGMVTAVLIASFISGIHWVHWIIAAMLIMIFGTLGDLCESMLKRNAGVKDSGKILPGHGGILDRFDAVFMSAPAVYFYFVVFVS